jgi:hypothetical protein
VGQAHLLINRVPVNEAGEPQLPPGLAAKVQELGLPLLGILPQDQLVAELDALGKPISDLPDDSLLRQQLVSLVGRVLPVAMPI